MTGTGSIAEFPLLAKISHELPVRYQVRAALAMTSRSGWKGDDEAVTAKR